MLDQYIKKVFETGKHGDAREESYYPALNSLVEAYSKDSGHSRVQITSQPKKTEAGNPDFRVWDGKHHVVGYIEAKPPSQENLEIIETSAQLKRYLHTFPNLILTNFFQFRLYRNGELIDAVQIARPFTVYKLKSINSADREGKRISSSNGTLLRLLASQDIFGKISGHRTRKANPLSESADHR